MERARHFDLTSMSEIEDPKDATRVFSYERGWFNAKHQRICVNLSPEKELPALGRWLIGLFEPQTTSELERFLDQEIGA